MIYVLDNMGHPLMPTERHGKVRRLLRDGLAHVVRVQPFTIQLDYESEKYKQDISLGIDTGSVHIGISATTEKKELFAAEIALRTDIVEKIATRRELRRARRYRKTRYRKARFNNRKKCENWFAPSIRYKVDKHLQVIRFVFSILPITKTTLEVAQFDIQKIKNPGIEGKEYQQGEMYGWNVREYVLARDKHTCQYCHGKSKDSILEVHHLESRKSGGNAPNNLITLCRTCHNAYHQGKIILNVKRGKSFRDAASMNIMRWAVYNKIKAEFPNVHLTYGYITKYTRINNDIKKSHCADAFCISKNVHARRLGKYYKCRCFPRHTRSLHVMKPHKGGIRRSTIASHWIGNSRLQRYDYVAWNGIKCFIFGSTNGRPVLRNVDGTRVTQTASVNSKMIKLENRNNKIIIYSVNNNTCET